MTTLLIGGLGPGELSDTAYRAHHIRRGEVTPTDALGKGIRNFKTSGPGRGY